MKGELLSIEQDPHHTLQQERVKYFITKHRPGILEVTFLTQEL